MKLNKIFLYILAAVGGHTIGLTLSTWFVGGFTYIFGLELEGWWWFIGIVVFTYSFVVLAILSLKKGLARGREK